RILARGAALGRRARAAIRLRDPLADQLVDPGAREPWRKGGRRPNLPRLRDPRRADRARRARVLCDFSAFLLWSARGVPLSPVRHLRADADLRDLADRSRPRPSPVRSMAVGGPRFLRAR